MLRVPLLCLAIFGAAWLEFTVFPGHSYLEGGTQILLPLVERADAPGLLSRDLVATSGSLAFTAYDEATLLLHQAGRLPLRQALEGQQFAFRVAALFGLFMLARATGLEYLFAFIIATLIELGATVAGPNLFLNDREPMPGSFAFSLVLLAMGLLARQAPLLAAVAGGVAFLYDPILAAPFWFVLLVAFAFDRDMRQVVRPMLPVFLIFVLLLANLAQLQPGTAGEPMLARVSPLTAEFQRTYAPELYVTAWQAGDLEQILALLTLGLWAAFRCRFLLSGCFRWLVLGTALCGLISIPLSYLLLDLGHMAWVARLQPTRVLLFSVVASALLFALAGMKAMRERSVWEAMGWFVALFALPVGHGIFEFLRMTPIALALAFGALLTGLLLGFASGRLRFLALASPVLAVVLLSHAGQRAVVNAPSTAALAAWADASTWGSSIFLFPDAGRAAYPSVFRVQSRHGLWVDWATARGVIYSDAAAARWKERWRDTMADGFSAARLESMLALPIDYYVVRSEHRLMGARQAFSTRDFVVYDAEDLRNASKPLRMAEGGP